ncbi:hypothetical protein CHELA20_51713 [Hyphomicrobiales bacterium]|nr:hypothetical protein CHELA20_51713 [Hyphomicrobiales bacterium]
MRYPTWYRFAMGISFSMVLSRVGQQAGWSFHERP